MRITRYTDYSLRVLIYLALQPERLSSIREISDSYSISEAHLMKVVQHLGQLGYVVTLRGRGGGLRLAGAPEDIRIGDVVRKMEDDLSLVECFADPGACCITAPCKLRHVLRQALDAFLAVLDDYTLADLTTRPRAKALKACLGLDAAE
ncbi:Rrf2 family transcriptional regulator [Methylocella silvestris]|uniref:Rrf2 family transcriptional regulator n=1 Tax=Methylocella silvestris TaxID=199596 RepID=A0A2J7TH92_METSI|nr:Rrf2 family transcriptional regulator [Methylocella silvestris]PNG26138.1 Rrf2 family transcriptional regulator [Methylocella silvestris]